MVFSTIDFEKACPLVTLRTFQVLTKPKSNKESFGLIPMVLLQLSSITSSTLVETFSNEEKYGAILIEMYQIEKSSSNSKFVLCKDGLIPVPLDDEPKKSLVESSALTCIGSTFLMLDDLTSLVIVSHYFKLPPGSKGTFFVLSRREMIFQVSNFLVEVALEGGMLDLLTKQPSPLN